MRRIKISAGHVSVLATLLENATADAIWDALPFGGRGNRWGDEIYFEIPVAQPQAMDARDVLEAGEFGYWPVGHAFCIFWGRTPASREDEIRASSPVNVFGRLEGDRLAFEQVSSGVEFTIEMADGPGAEVTKEPE